MSRLRILFEGREKQLEAVEHALQGQWLLRDETEHLLAQCEQLGIEGVGKIGSDVGSAGKFNPVLSEVRAAILFARLGAKVSILRDQEFGCPKTGQAYYAPDLSVSFGDLEMLVEVFHSYPATPDVCTPLHRGIEKRGLPFRVTYHLGSDLSVPGFGRNEREKHEKLVKAVIEEALDKLSALPPGSTGEIQVGEHRFFYEPSTLERGYAAGSLTALHSIDANKHERKFLDDLSRKAQRRASLPSHRQRTPFVVAYVSEEPELADRHVLSALTGARHFSYSPPPVSHPPEVMAAWNSPWQRLLREWDYGSDAKCRILRCGVLHGGQCQHNPGAVSTGKIHDHYGAFDGSDWAKNLSAVMVVHGPRRLRGPKIQWLPNPFAAEAIRELRLLDLGLSVDQERAPHPNTLE
jgi:hypothetical protein